MKKRVVFTLLSLLCAFCCAFALVACGDEGGSSGGIYIVRSDGTVVEDGNLGECTYGSSDFGNVFDFKLCTKDSDGKFVDLAESEVTVTYKRMGEVINPAPTGYSDFGAGFYEIEFKYKDNVAYASFSVNKSDKNNFRATVSKVEWKYGEEGATVAVYDGDKQLDKETDYYGGPYYVSVADYDAIKDDADFVDKLEQKTESYDFRYLTPGTYYLFAYYGNALNYNGGYTDFKKVTVRKGDLTIVNEENLCTEAYSYNNIETVGNIKLSDIAIKTYAGDDYENAAYAVNAFGHKVYGEFVWRNPDTQINALKSGNYYPATFIPDEQERDYYNYTMVNAGQVEITVNKGYVHKPAYTEVEWAYSGKAEDVYIYDVYDYDEVVQARRGDTQLDVERVASYSFKIDSITEVGTYTYTISLKNKDNFYWVEHDENPFESDQTDTADWTMTVKILPRESYLGTRGAGPMLVPDNNGVIMLPIAQFATPYKAGTLNAEYYSNPDDDSTYPNDLIYSADVCIVTDDGVDYLRISNIEKIREGGTTGIPIRFTAEGDDHYADIDIVSYDFIPEFRITCSFNVEKLVIYRTTTAGVLYDSYTSLRTTVGDFKLQMKSGSSAWMNINENQMLPEVDVEYEFRLVFDVASDKIDERVVVYQSEFEFTIKCVEVECPMTAGTVLNATVGVNVYDLLEERGYELENEYGSWEVKCYEDGEWINYGGGFEITEGETLCRLFFPSYYLYGAPDPIEFTIVGAN